MGISLVIFAFYSELLCSISKKRLASQRNPLVSPPPQLFVSSFLTSEKEFCQIAPSNSLSP